jgi:hypothetical protein
MTAAASLDTNRPAHVSQPDAKPGTCGRRRLGRERRAQDRALLSRSAALGCGRRASGAALRGAATAKDGMSRPVGLGVAGTSPPQAQIGGRPPKTERPHRVLREDPITHHVADPHRVEHQDKPGHSRAPPLGLPPHTRAADHPDARPLQQHQLHLTHRPGTDKRKPSWPLLPGEGSCDLRSAARARVGCP